MHAKTLILAAILLSATAASAQETAVATKEPIAVVTPFQPNAGGVPATETAPIEVPVATNTIAVENAPVATLPRTPNAGSAKQPDTPPPASERGTSVPIGPSPVEPVQQTGGSGWEFAFAPYLYMTGMSGTIGARGTVADVDLTFSDITANFDFGLMGAFQARKGKFVFFSDLLWLRLSEERETPRDLFSDVRLGVDLVVFDPEAGVRVVDSSKGSIDVVGGLRIMSIENDLEFGTGIAQGFRVSQRKTWAMPVAGIFGTRNLSEKVFITGKFDVGGWSSNFTTQIYAGGGYRITPRVALIGGYRFLKTDYSDDAGFVFDTEMNGILLGAKFTF